MNPIIRSILGRRSIRRYSDEIVAPDDLEVILAAGLAGPSACNFRPVHLIVLDDRTVIDRFAVLHKFAAMAASAPLVIAVCVETNLSTISSHYWRDDGAAAMENILLAAHALGYGAVWCGGIIHCTDHQERHTALRELLGLPDQVEPLGYAVIGRSAEFKEPYTTPGDRTKIHHLRW